MKLDYAILKMCYSSVVLVVFSISLIDAVVVPSEVSGVSGGQITLTCTFVETSSTPPTISWTKSESGGSTRIVASSVSGVSHISNSFVDRANLDGANLTISLLKLSDSGSYTCSVIAVSNPQESGTTVLRVTATPIVSAFSIKHRVVGSNGNYAAAVCTAAGGKPRAVVTWTDANGEVQASRVSARESDDGSVDVESVLLLTPGLLGRSINSTSPVSADDKLREFFCDVTHENWSLNENQLSPKVVVELLYAPIAHISLLGNQLTCNVEGNPKPTLTWFLPDGSIVYKAPSVYVAPTAANNGRYVCMATSSLEPAAIASLDIHKANDLPTLFRTLLQENTSLPVTATGFVIECSADLTSPEIAHDGLDIRFEWSRDETPIAISSTKYSIQSREIRSALGHVRLLSSLRFVDIARGRDDATFRCQLVNTTTTTGFVSSLERAVKVTVDYPPESKELQISSVPSHGVIREGEDLQLHCSTNSHPISTYDWYFNGEKVGTGSFYTLKNIQRHEAGIYRCKAYNYVPGIAAGDIAITVEFPPSSVYVEENKDVLSCFSKSGGVPWPIYKWKLPNGTETAGNMSLLRNPASTGKYVCSVRNIHGISNVTYVKVTGPTQLIGSLSVAEFVTTLVLCVVFAVILACIIGWLTYKRFSFRKSQEASSDERLKRYLQFMEPPESGNSVVKSLNRCGVDEPRKSTVRNIRFAESPVPMEEDVREALSVPAAVTRVRVDQSTPSSNIDKYRCYMAVDGSSIEIVENDSLPSPQNCNQMRESPNDDTKRLQPRHKTRPLSEDIESASENCSQATRETTMSSPVRLARVRRDAARSLNEPNFVPMQYYQATLPRTGRIPPRLPMHYKPPPGAVVVSGFEPVLYDETWRPGLPQYMMACSGSHIGPYSSHRVPHRPNGSEETTIHSDTSTTASEDYLHGVKRNLPRSMSLSASDSSSATTSESTNSNVNAITTNSKISKTNPSGKQLRGPSPFDSGNDSAKSNNAGNASKRQQSLTLV